jgi:hypothetical protein
LAIREFAIPRAEQRVGDRNVELRADPLGISDQRRTRRRAPSKPTDARPLGCAWNGAAPDARWPEGALSPGQRTEMAVCARASGEGTLIRADIIHTADTRVRFQRWRPELTIHRHPARHRAGKCGSCCRSFNKVPLAPMLEDAVWCKLAAESEVLCAECCFKRAYERDIDLTRANLRLCALNLAGWPSSYVNLFTDAKKQSSEGRPHVDERYLETWGASESDRVAHRDSSATVEHQGGAS